ncbi:MAG: Maf family protein, partial [Bacteroidales bacterium]|nr:Maf family protein [Bacteroidales bacterium]
MLKNHKLVLASASPRRRELLKGLDFNFSVEPSPDNKEIYPENLPWQQIPEFLARCKSDSFHRQLAANEILITADTLVFLPDANGEMQILGKPKDREDAFKMLTMLSGNSHKVLTGVVLRNAKGDTYSFTDSTEVTFNQLSNNLIGYYLDNYAPFDKAGAYGVQEWIG